jgi:hypothetical protein
MALKFRFNETKNQLLKATRGVGFDEAIEAIKQGGLLADIVHPSLEHARQRLYIVNINNYAYGLPYIIEEDGQSLFLKTLYPSRVLTKKFLLRKS